MHIGAWDIVLIAAVSCEAAFIAYIYDPKWKAFILTLPIPFTIATLALGRPVDSTNVLGLIVLLIFAHLVRGLHYGMSVAIVPSIVASALVYCGIGTAAARVVPATDAAFWLSVGGTVTIAVVLLLLLPHREEEGHRASLPVWIKLPIIVCVVCALVAIKSSLKGFMTVFPMVGVIAAYEARKSLWTISRQIPVLMLGMTAMMIASRLSYSRVGIGWSLVFGWLAFAVVATVAMRVSRSERAGG